MKRLQQNGTMQLVYTDSEISQTRGDSTKLPSSRIYLPLDKKCRNEVVQVLTER